MIRIAIVSDITLLRAGLACLLDREPAIEVVGLADAQTAAELVSRVRPTVVLVDNSMPNSERSIRRVCSLRADVKVVALGVSDTAEEVIPCIEAGASGYSPRDVSLSELVKVIRSVNSDEIICSPRTVALLARRLSSLALGRPVTRPGVLSLREVEVARLVADGLPNREIAERLSIQTPTVKNHVHNILEKLGLESRAAIGSQLARRRRREVPGGTDRDPRQRDRAGDGTYAPSN